MFTSTNFVSDRYGNSSNNSYATLSPLSSLMLRVKYPLTTYSILSISLLPITDISVSLFPIELKLVPNRIPADFERIQRS